MPRTLYDEAGNEIEVPEETELDSLKAAAEEAAKLKEEIKTIEDKSVGVKSLREALKRKESLITDLQKKLEGKPEAAAKNEEQKASTVSLDEDKIRSMTRDEASRILMETEVVRHLAEYSDDDRKLIRKTFDKLSAGEELNVDTLPVFLEQAARATFPASDARATGIMHTAGGRPPRVESDSGKSFADSDAGKELARRLGMRLEKPNKK